MYFVHSPVDSKCYDTFGLFWGSLSNYKFDRYCHSVRLIVHETKILRFQSTCFGLGTDVEVTSKENNLLWVFGKFIFCHCFKEFFTSWNSFVFNIKAVTSFGHVQIKIVRVFLSGFCIYFICGMCRGLPSFLSCCSSSCFFFTVVTDTPQCFAVLSSTWQTRKIRIFFSDYCLWRLFTMYITSYLLYECFYPSLHWSPLLDVQFISLNSNLFTALTV